MTSMSTSSGARNFIANAVSSIAQTVSDGVSSLSVPRHTGLRDNDASALDAAGGSPATADAAAHSTVIDLHHKADAEAQAAALAGRKGTLSADEMVIAKELMDDIDDIVDLDAKIEETECVRDRKSRTAKDEEHQDDVRNGENVVESWLRRQVLQRFFNNVITRKLGLASSRTTDGADTEDPSTAAA